MRLSVERLREYAEAAGRHLRHEAGGLPSGAIAGQISREVWDTLHERDQRLLLAIDDCEAGRFPPDSIYLRATE